MSSKSVLDMPPTIVGSRAFMVRGQIFEMTNDVAHGSLKAKQFFIEHVRLLEKNYLELLEPNRLTAYLQRTAEKLREQPGWLGLSSNNIYLTLTVVSLGGAVFVIAISYKKLASCL